MSPQQRRRCQQWMKPRDATQLEGREGPRCGAPAGSEPPPPRGHGSPAQHGPSHSVVGTCRGLRRCPRHRCPHRRCPHRHLPRAGRAARPRLPRLVTAAEFMNLSEWKKAASLYHIQRKLSFKRKFSVITLKGAILTQSVTTLTCC